MTPPPKDVNVLSILRLIMETQTKNNNIKVHLSLIDNGRQRLILEGAITA